MYKSWYVFQYDGQKSESEIKLHAFLFLRQILSEEQLIFLYKNTQTVTLINALKLKKLSKKNFEPIFVFKFSNSRIFQLATKM